MAPAGFSRRVLRAVDGVEQPRTPPARRVTAEIAELGNASHLWSRPACRNVAIDVGSPANTIDVTDVDAQLERGGGNEDFQVPASGVARHRAGALRHAAMMGHDLTADQPMRARAPPFAAFTKMSGAVLPSANRANFLPHHWTSPPAAARTASMARRGADDWCRRSRRPPSCDPTCPRKSAIRRGLCVADRNARSAASSVSAARRSIDNAGGCRACYRQRVDPSTMWCRWSQACFVPTPSREARTATRGW